MIRFGTTHTVTAGAVAKFTWPGIMFYRRAPIHTLTRVYVMMKIRFIHLSVAFSAGYITAVDGDK